MVKMPAIEWPLMLERKIAHENIKECHFYVIFLRFIKCCLNNLAIRLICIIKQVASNKSSLLLKKLSTKVIREQSKEAWVLIDRRQKVIKGEA
jgi:hypothetical protein